MTTPAPPAMTPEQRAALAAVYRANPFVTLGAVDAADQLEADGVTIATLTAECDAAQAHVKAILATLVRSEQQLKEAEAAIATAREDGMREAIAILRDVTVERPQFDEARRVASKAIEATIAKGATT